MIRTLLSSCSLAGLAVFGALPATAATCTEPAIGVFVCAAPGSDPVSSALAGASVTVAPGASVESDDADATPIELSGGGTSVENDGVISQTATNNGGYAITGEGAGLSIVNRGRISSGDRGIEMLSGSDLSVVNEAGALIESRRQGVRSGSDVPDAYVENAGTIRATEGRAVQLRSFGATLINSGELIGGEEVVEARGNFTLENTGTIRLIDETVEDEDGVQFASGTARNWGIIRGTDDGIDIDEGLIENYAGGQIISLAPDANDNSGIDVDEVYDDEINPIRAAGALTIRNWGLIEGPSAIGTDADSTSELTIENGGVLLGRGGTAIRMAPGQGASSLLLFGDSEVYGDVNFGGGDDLLTLSGLTSGLIGDGIFDGGAGTDRVVFDGYTLDDLKSFGIADDLVTLALFSGGDLLTAQFRSFESWTVGGTTYGTAELRQELQPVPLPAGMPLLVAALGGLAFLRRRG